MCSYLCKLSFSNRELPCWTPSKLQFIPKEASNLPCINYPAWATREVPASLSVARPTLQHSPLQNAKSPSKHTQGESRVDFPSPIVVQLLVVVACTTHRIRTATFPGSLTACSLVHQILIANTQ